MTAFNQISCGGCKGAGRTCAHIQRRTRAVFIQLCARLSDCGRYYGGYVCHIDDQAEKFSGDRTIQDISVQDRAE